MSGESKPNSWAPIHGCSSSDGVQSGSGRYKELSASQRNELLSKQARMLDTIEGKHSTAELNNEERVEVFNTLEYIEATEEANFKSTMTLLGCSVLWLSLAFLILSVWFPCLGWAIVPVFAIFLALQAFRWALPETRKGRASSQEPQSGSE